MSNQIRADPELDRLDHATTVLVVVALQFCVRIISGLYRLVCCFIPSRTG